MPIVDFKTRPWLAEKDLRRVAFFDAIVDSFDAHHSPTDSWFFQLCDSPKTNVERVLQWQWLVVAVFVDSPNEHGIWVKSDPPVVRIADASQDLFVEPWFEAAPGVHHHPTKEEEWCLLLACVTQLPTCLRFLFLHRPVHAVLEIRWRILEFFESLRLCQRYFLRQTTTLTTVTMAIVHSVVERSMPKTIASIAPDRIRSIAHAQDLPKFALKHAWEIRMKIFYRTCKNTNRVVEDKWICWMHFEYTRMHYPQSCR